MHAEFDAICVGSGITSLAFAAHVVRSRPGTRLLILEKHLVSGGYATVFRRPKQGTIFDCSLHKLSGMGREGNLSRIFDQLGLLDMIDLVYPKTYFEANFENATLPLPQSADAVRKVLKRQFPEEADGLDAFWKELMCHGKNAYMQFQILEGNYEPNLADLRFAHQHLRPLTALEGIARHIRHPQLLDMLCASAVYVGALPEELGYLYYLHIIYATLVAGNAYVKGSSQALSDTLVDLIQSAGGVVRNRETVQRVLYDDQLRVTGVVTKKGRYSAPLVMMNAAPRYALDQLFDDHPAIDSVRKKAASLRSSLSTTTLYLVLDTPPEELGLACSEMMIFQTEPHQAAAQRSAAEGSEAATESAYWWHAPMEITNYHLLNPSGGYVVILNVLDRLDHWPTRKTPEYRAKKARAAKVMLERLLERKPAVAGHVKYQEISSPHTYQRYTNNTDGAGYGAFVGPNAASHLFHHGFPVKGVHFLSAWVAGPSYEAAFGYAEMKANTLFSAHAKDSSVRLAAE